MVDIFGTSQQLEPGAVDATKAIQTGPSAIAPFVIRVPTPTILTVTPATDFDAKLEDWDNHGQFFQNQSNVTQQQLSGQSEWLATEKMKTTTGPGPIPAGTLPESFPVPADTAFAELVVESTLFEFEKNDFFARIYLEVPVAISGGAVSSVDEVLTLLKPPQGLTSKELSGVRDVVSDMFVWITGTAGEPAEEGLELPELVAPSPVSVVPVGLHQLTVQEIIRSLKIPAAPESAMTQAEWSEYLSSKGYTDEDINNEVQITAEQIIADWQERTNQIAAFRAGIAEMPRWGIWDALKTLVVAPGLELAEIGGMYFSYVTQPLAGFIYGKIIPDIHTEYVQIKQANPNISDREALAHAWVAWDAPFSGAAEWILKYMLMEGLVDPLTYVGWGIATRIAKPIPYIGRLVGAGEHGAMAVMELPFDALKRIGATVPKTMTQRAVMAQHESLQYVERYLTRITGKPLSAIKMKEFTPAIERAVKYAMENPQAEDYMALAGRAVLMHPPIDELTVKSWAEIVGSTLRSEDITRVTIESIDNVFEDMFAKRPLPVREAAGRLLVILHVSPADGKALKAAERLFTNRADVIERGALDFARAKTPLKAMKALAIKGFRTHLMIEESAAALARREAGAYTTLLHNQNLRLQAIWRNGIDRWVVRPFAEAYLTFGLYGPMNVLEDYIRSTLGGVLPRRMNTEYYEKVFIGLLDDPELKRSGLSEMLGPVAKAREGEARDWNNWIIQMATLGQKGWADKVYEGLVRIPGGYGMEIRRNFRARRYLQILAENGGDAFKALAEAGPKNLPDLADKKFLKDFESTMYALRTTGNEEAVAGAKEMFTGHKLKRAEVSNILKEYPDLPNTARDHIMGAYDDGSLFHDVPARIKMAYEDFELRPEVTRLNHTLKDIERVASGSGTVKLYHGAPTEFAEALVKLRPRVPYKVEDVAREVASKYGLTYKEFYRYAHRRHEVVEGLSVSTAAVASRWGQHFPLGEVLTDLNSKARKLVRAKEISATTGKRVSNVIEDLNKEAASIAEKRGTQFTFENAADILDLPDLYKLKSGTGALVELEIETAKIPASLRHGAQFELEALKRADISEAELLDIWNYSYKDFKVQPDAIKSSRIVVRDMPQPPIEKYIPVPNSIDNSIKTVDDEILDDFIRGPEVAAQQYRQLADFLVALDVQNPQEMATAIQALYKMSEIYGALPEQIIAQATVRSRGLNLAERRATFDADFDRVYQFLDSAGADIGRVMAKLDAVNIGSASYKGARTKLLGIMATKRELALEFRTQNMALRHDTFRGVSGKELKTTEFWDSFYLQMGNDYGAFNLKMSKLDAQMARTIEDMNRAAGAKIPARVPIVVRDRPLSPQDVAALLGVRGDDISRALLDVLTVQNNKDYFVQYVISMTRSGDKGFTEEAVGAVYDQIAYSLRVSPESMSWITGKRIELDGVRRELHDLYRSKAFSDEDIASLHKYIDETVEAMKKLKYEVPALREALAAGPAEARIKPPKPPVKVLKPEFAKYDEIRQAAADESLKWYYKEYPDYTNANAFDAMMKCIYPYWSISEDTEVMSRRGWKYYWELDNSDELLSFDKSSELTYWDKIQYVNVYDYSGEAVWLYDRGRDFVCTPNHWWLVKRERKKDWEFVRADQLYPQMRFPKAAPHSFDGDSLLNPDAAAILGWLVTDGTVKRKQYCAYIQQSKQPYVDEIRELLVRNNAYVSEAVYDDSGTYHFRVTPEWRKCLVGLLDTYGLKYVVSHLSQEASEAMWQAMWKAEGCNRTGCFVQKEGEVLDAFELLSFLTGRFVARHIHNGKQDSRNIWQLYVHKTKQQCNGNLLIDRVPYSGKMWCPKVEHRTILIRRNNKVCWTGNTYESQRWFWLPRAFIRHPGIFTSFGRWQNNSDFGYVHIPGTSVDINPFRGTVFGTLTTRLTRRDYPEYYDSLGALGGMVEFNDFLSRYGFYPGAHVGIPLALMGGLETQMGETMPAVWKTPLNLLIAAFPSNSSVKWLSDHIFSDRYRDYMTILEVNKQGFDGVHIWTKIQQGISLTPEEQSAWDNARRWSALYGVLFEQMSLFRFRPEEQTRAYNEATQVIEDMTGYTAEQQDWLQKHGYRVWDMVGGLSPTNQAILQEMDIYKWIGVNAPLLPGKQQLEIQSLDLAWDDVMHFVEGCQNERIQLQADLLAGRIGPRDYNAKLQAIYTKQRDYIDNKAVENPLMTLDGRMEYYKKYGISPPVQHPMKELMNLYFSIELQEVTDPDTGELVTDWDTFFAQRQAIEDAIPEELKGEWEAYLSRNTTRMEEVRRDVYNTYFRKYYDLWDESLSAYPENEQKLINEFLYLSRTGQNLDRQAEIQGVVSAKTGNLLIASFRSDVSANRQALRYANPYLDAWLYYWGRTTTFMSPQAEAIYRQLLQDTGRSAI